MRQQIRSPKRELRWKNLVQTSTGKKSRSSKTLILVGGEKKDDRTADSDAHGPHGDILRGVRTGVTSNKAKPPETEVRCKILSSQMSDPERKGLRMQIGNNVFWNTEEAGRNITE
jgi:hypothetical protein